MSMAFMHDFYTASVYMFVPFVYIVVCLVVS